MHGQKIDIIGQVPAVPRDNGAAVHLLHEVDNGSVINVNTVHHSVLLAT